MAIETKDLMNEMLLSGVVGGYKIERKEEKAKFDGFEFKKGDKVYTYSGYISVQTGENQFATIRVRSRIESYWEGKLDATSQVLKDMSEGIVETYLKTRDLTKTPQISIYGRDKKSGASHLKLTDNFYWKDGNLNENLGFELGFARISLKEPSEQPRLQNELVVNGVVDKITPEINVDGEETGRVKLVASVPYLSGTKDNPVIRCTQVDFVIGTLEEVDEEGNVEVIDLAQEVLDSEDEIIGLSWELIAENNGYYEEIEVEQEEPTSQRRFGKSRSVVNTKRKSHTEFLLVGLNPLGNDGEFFEEDDIREAINARRVAIEEAKKRAEENEQEKKTETRQRGFRSTGSTSTEGATGASQRRFRR